MLYWKNSNADQPLLDSIFQKVALRRKNGFNKKFSNIQSNFIFESFDTDGKKHRIETHIYDSNRLNKSETCKEETEDKIKEAIKKENRSEDRYAVLHLTGMNVDIRVYQHLQNNGKSIMGEINKKTQLPIITMNFPNFGKTALDNEHGFSLDNNYKVAKQVILTMADLYKINTKNIILWGECLGGITAIKLANEFNNKLIILDSVPTHYNDTLPTALEKILFTPIKPFILNKSIFDMADSIKKIKGKVIARHHPEDKIISFDATRRFCSHHIIIPSKEIDLNRSRFIKSNYHCLDKHAIASLINEVDFSKL